MLTNLRAALALHPHPTTIVEFVVIVDALLAVPTDEEPARSVALQSVASTIDSCIWRIEKRQEARELAARTRAGIDPNADELDGFDMLACAGLLKART